MFDLTALAAAFALASVTIAPLAAIAETESDSRESGGFTLPTADHNGNYSSATFRGFDGSQAGFWIFWKTSRHVDCFAGSGSGHVSRINGATVVFTDSVFGQNHRGDQFIRVTTTPFTQHSNRTQWCFIRAHSSLINPFFPTR